MMVALCYYPARVLRDRDPLTLGTTMSGGMLDGEHDVEHNPCLMHRAIYKAPFFRHTNSVKERGRDHETRRETTRRVILISASSIDPDQ